MKTLALNYTEILALTEVSHDVDLKKFLELQLASYPAALSSEDGYIRDVSKSNLAKLIVSITSHPDCVDIGSECRIVKDGCS